LNRGSDPRVTKKEIGATYEVLRNDRILDKKFRNIDSKTDIRMIVIFNNKKETTENKNRYD
jgi:hypothetical protein